MSTDVDIICDAIPTIYEFWAQFIEVIIGFGLLWRQLGWVAAVPLMIVACKCSSQFRRAVFVMENSHGKNNRGKAIFSSGLVT